MRDILRTFVILLIVSGFALSIYATLSGKVNTRGYEAIPHHYATHFHR
jgi:hypothetical protein